MTDTASTPTRPTWTRWLYPILAITGTAVGIVVIVAVLYLLFSRPGCCPSMMKADPPAAQQMDCCAAMMKDMKMPPGPGKPSMPPMPMPSHSGG
ncbi:hypothetical protein [Mycobacterium intracellulare]|uniref:hypothetical protein n=1 Tax=Mycobacterium intracellulare TaxID=1767 RepID=UPI001EED40FE|nr:hypothetical protein [Mycobacterium intracellulare]MEE3750097.1 hypothetical protein [Mycobacterium intracellulare]